VSNHASSDDRDFRVVVLSGPSGSGKTTIVNRLVTDSPVPLVESVSATTRRPRTGEVSGRNYYFLSPEEFETRRAAGDFLEFAEVHGSGHWYGTLKSELSRARAAGAWALLEIDVQGALNVMQEYPDAVTIFLKTPSEAEYEQRLRARGTETDEVIQRRLKTARDELKLADRYRYQVVNDDLDRAVREIQEILVEEAAQHA
jgi:guanylate kinase